jgi:hypothetical protein
MLDYPVAAFNRERAVEPSLLVIACIVGALVIWGCLRLGAKRPTAGWVWALLFLFGIALVVDLISITALGTNTNTTFSTVPRQKEAGK